MKRAALFSTIDQNGNIIRLQDFLGQKVLLYFYPKDMTPGCTTEALGFQEKYDTFKTLDTEILAVSKDPIESHQEFCKQHNLEFPLLLDTDGTIAEQYDVFENLKTKDARPAAFSRESFLINEQGYIIKHWEKVNPAIHPQEVIEYIQSH